MIGRDLEKLKQYVTRSQKFTKAQQLHKPIEMNNNATIHVLSFIEELKTGITSEEIESIESEREDIIWSEVDEVVQDLYYETLGDAKKGFYN